VDCATGNAADQAVCDDPTTKALVESLVACQKAACAEPCTPPPPPDPTCNPITNQGCDEGSSCDFAFDNFGQPFFKCWALPAPTVAQCAVCDDKNTACLPGFTCFGTCAKFCCSDDECGSTACDFTQGAFGVGVCVDAMQDASCDAPAGWTSMGSCLMGWDAGAPPPPDGGSDASMDDGGSDASIEDAGSDASMDDGGSDAGDGGP
jgi:hypothetical protein